VFRIARRVAKDRIISTVDPDARHGHKTSARGFDGYKGHVAVDPDSELITATTVTAGNVGDGQAVEALLADELAGRGEDDRAADQGLCGAPEAPLAVYGDSAYGAGSVLDTLEQADAEIMCKVQPPHAPGGRFAKDAFGIDLTAGTVTCPAGLTAPLRAIKDGHIAHFATACQGCPLADQCTTSTSGRSIHVGLYEQQLTRARARQTDPAWKADYTATRPKVERKISHLMRRRHGGRRARVERNGGGGYPSRAALDAAQRVEHRFAGAGRLERHDLKQHGQEAPQARVPAQQLGAERGVLTTAVKLRCCEATDCVAGSLELAAADASADRGPERVKAAGRRVEQHEHRGA
jgi:hypothetical protein